MEYLSMPECYDRAERSIPSVSKARRNVAFCVLAALSILVASPVLLVALIFFSVSPLASVALFFITGAAFAATWVGARSAVTDPIYYDLIRERRRTVGHFAAYLHETQQQPIDPRQEAWSLLRRGRKIGG